jgi:uncharacterized protein DUF397
MDADLSRAAWHKSTFSNGSGGDCVEVARNLPGIVAVRDSKRPDGAKLIIGSAAWRTFVAAIREGRFQP